MTYLDAEESLLWSIGAAANGASALLMLALAGLILASLPPTRQPGRDPLGDTLAAVFVVTGLSHALHVGFFTLRVAHRSFMVATVSLDLLCTLAVGAYLVLRVRDRSPTRSDDLRRDELALQYNDRVVQRLAEANLALEMGEHDVLRSALGDGLREAKAVSAGLLRTRGGSA